MSFIRSAVQIRNSMLAFNCIVKNFQVFHSQNTSLISLLYRVRTIILNRIIEKIDKLLNFISFKFRVIKVEIIQFDVNFVKIFYFYFVIELKA